MKCYRPHIGQGCSSSPYGVLPRNCQAEMHTSMLHSTGVWCLQAHVEHKFAWTSYIASGTIRMSICMLSSTCAARRIAHQHLKMPTYFKKRPCAFLAVVSSSQSMCSGSLPISIVCHMSVCVCVLCIFMYNFPDEHRREP